ncbi:MAG: copper amine oxidase N-terminal domain-containing protein [Clostridiales bacterium]|nr:copper amine oxidase N-terminal domain-containing protein [Clostridiales bacterium]
MKRFFCTKRFLAFLMAAVIAAGVFAANPMPAQAYTSELTRYEPGDSWTISWDNGMVIEVVVKTPFEQLGHVKIGNLWEAVGNTYNEETEMWEADLEPIEYYFGVLVVEDGVEEILYDMYTVERPVDVITWPYGEGEDSYISTYNGKPEIGWEGNSTATDVISDGEYGPISHVTKDDPYPFVIDIRNDGGISVLKLRQNFYEYFATTWAELFGDTGANADEVVYSFYNPDNPDEWAYYWWQVFSYVIFTRSQYEEYARTGVIPVSDAEGVDYDNISVLKREIYEQLDFSDVKALLDARIAGDTGAPAEQPAEASAPVTDVTVLYNGVKVEFTQPPVQKNGYVFYPLEDVFTGFGAVQGWDGETFTFSGQLNGSTVEIPLRDLSYWVNGAKLDVAAELTPFIENERTYVYLDYIVEGLGLSVAWDGVIKTIAITD